MHCVFNFMNSICAKLLLYWHSLSYYYCYDCLDDYKHNYKRIQCTDTNTTHAYNKCDKTYMSVGPKTFPPSKKFGSTSDVDFNHEQLLGLNLGYNGCGGRYGHC